ncbi:MAG: DJ-1/PfpI family protein [Spirochaetales bacterium]|nr:DJ-1/PfpI family protein [Spirochaetales bacterium]
MKEVAVFLAEGFEEVEAITPIDFLRRANVNVTTVGLGTHEILGSHGIKVIADEIFSNDIKNKMFDCLVLPGGKLGSDNLSNNNDLLEMIEDHNKAGKIISAICAAPGVVLSKTSVLNGKKATCYPGFEKFFMENTTFCADRVVTDNNLITSRGAGTAAEFAIELIKVLVNTETALEIKSQTIQNF